jgi:outer membrane protein assembly factor BamB
MFPGKKWAVRVALMWIVAGVAGAAERTNAAELPPLPQGLASFGAATQDHYLYVYGGHSGATHVHSVDDQSRRFLRLDLDAPKAWEDLGEVDALQGVPLVPFNGGVCKVGGMKALNQRGEPEDLVSVADFACWLPAEKRWVAMPPMPAPRSTHDAVFHDGKIYVAGGWRLGGKGTKGVWSEDLLIFEPSTGAGAPGAWKSVPQPFARRALAVVVAGKRLYAIGGIERQGGTSRRTDVYDLETGQWTEEAKLPYVGDLDGFGVAAVGTEHGILMSASDGIVQALASTGGEWRDAGQRWREHRFFHRLLTYGETLLAIAGATAQGHSATLEQQPLPGAAAFAPPAAVAAADPAVWPGFRGHGDGQAPQAEMSTEATVAWRLAVPGYGQSSPVVWGDQALLTSVVGAQKEELILSAFDLASGEVRWRRRFPASLLLKSGDMVSRAAPTPVVDADRIYAFWESGDLYAVDHRGETLWRRQLATEYGAFQGNHGLGSSLILAGGVLVVQVTHAGPSYLLGIDTAGGKNLWKHELPAKVAWTTPVAAMATVAPQGRPQVIVSANGLIAAIDAQSGERLWTLSGIEKNTSSSPIVSGDLLIAPGSEVSSTVALRLGGRGDLAPEAVLWRATDSSAGFASPVLAGGCLILVNKTGIAACVDPASGTAHWQERLGDEVWASPIAAGDRVFFFTKKGKRLVYQVSPAAARQLASAELATEDVVYGAAAAPGAFLLRTGHELLRLSAVSAPAAPAQAP